MKYLKLATLFILSAFFLQGCADGYKVVFINGLDTKYEIYMQRKPPKRPLKFSDNDPRQYKSIEGKTPPLEGRLVAVFNGKGDMLYNQTVKYPKRNEKFQRESFTGTKELFLYIDKKSIKQISIQKAESIMKSYDK